MAVLNKDQILKAEDLKSETVSVSEWGGDVIVRTMTGVERDEFETTIFEGKGNDTKKNLTNVRAKLAALCMVDESGNRLFSSKEAEALGKKSSKALDRVYTVAAKLNGIGAQEVEELTKN